jgi:hypothetical protein
MNYNSNTKYTVSNQFNQLPSNNIGSNSGLLNQEQINMQWTSSIQQQNFQHNQIQSSASNLPAMLGQLINALQNGQIVQQQNKPQTQQVK